MISGCSSKTKWEKARRSCDRISSHSQSSNPQHQPSATGCLSGAAASWIHPVERGTTRHIIFASRILHNILMRSAMRLTCVFNQAISVSLTDLQAIRPSTTPTAILKHQNEMKEDILILSLHASLHEELKREVLVSM